jgi:hypothetical protein
MSRYLALLSLILCVASCESKPTLNPAPHAAAQANPSVAATAEVGEPLVDTSYATLMYRLKDQYSVILFFKRDRGGAANAFWGFGGHRGFGGHSMELPVPALE